MSSYTAFSGRQRAAAGSLADIVHALTNTPPADATLLVFDDTSGDIVELDLHGSLEKALARLPEAPGTIDKPGPGRPKLGVVAREVTLLPRHWEWLAAQPGGASVVLRKLVEEASRSSRAKDKARASCEACHRFMSHLCGDEPGFEEATRALFAGDFDSVRTQIVRWPADLCAYAEKLLYAAQHDAYEARED
ncbi:MAG: hypothetical protein CGU28_01830 [Candidatus Dactylopiibacterium carminicum]|uniref:DUF2239 domain-containing protein n=1 Tax=Candidatus Dactylopiibacterium carminicum TaxID=857335 RepID=A0A272ETF4_9RHOO|nr:DUF2239 family protein [Candidatus Dactylopiibacterium carminicum]KAF7599359.1 DUF2239 domain-containing protein [Candidatus Dactylopiibacterium carminicum]PAS93368.1 MAG: hypothetical protein CGU29_07975 [Candidatus Dactylopiibacterium carminicum]PAS98322.1 MAG: hypothetical protein CGU28_01830 [Candidatus Dactylopiibacterium carminicum]PAS99367.1 MAG: hypothetical protein BSR46_08355 [Candidatus Dactylopiibacterium carminicum]